VASFATRDEATDAADLLSRYTFPRHRLSLVGGDPRPVAPTQSRAVGWLTRMVGRADRPRLAPTRFDLCVDAEVAICAWRLLVRLRPTGMAVADRLPVVPRPVPTGAA